MSDQQVDSGHHPLNFLEKLVCRGRVGGEIAGNAFGADACGPAIVDHPFGLRISLQSMQTNVCTGSRQ